MILDKDNICIHENGDIEVPLFSLTEVSNPIDNFSVDNKLGEGGLGPVYKVIYQETLCTHSLQQFYYEWWLFRFWIAFIIIYYFVIAI